jgi:hypothetical protein
MFIDVDPIGHIPENARAGTRVEGLRIKATDYDKLSENTTRYALTLNTKSIDGSDVFRIDEMTADIYLNVDNYLDREKTPHHNLSVIARDSGDQSGNLQSKELKITIIIDDVNDMPVRFYLFREFLVEFSVFFCFSHDLNQQINKHKYRKQHNVEILLQKFEQKMMILELIHIHYMKLLKNVNYLMNK